MSNNGNNAKNVSLYEQVLEAIPDGVTVQDMDFNIIFQNTFMRGAFGDQIGHKCYAVYERRAQVCEGCGLVKAYKTGKPVLVHRTGVMESGEVGHWENSCFPLFDAEGNIVAGVEVCRDIGDRVSLAQEVRNRTIELGSLNDQLNRQKMELEQRSQELRDAYKELQRTHTHMLQQEKMASIGQLAAGIAHEINTPIQFMGDNISFLHESFDEIIGCISRCQEISGLTDENNKELIRLYKQADSIFKEVDFEYLKTEIPLAFDQTAGGVRRVTEIVQALKSFARHGDTTLGPVNVDELIHSVVEITRSTWSNVADMSVELAAPPLVVKGLHSELGQALLNLILNAADALATARCQKSEPKHIKIESRQTDGWGEIVVRDNGCGMEPSLLNKIFEPFFTTKEVGRGSGQGLSIAYNIITEAHAGELRVESELGKGSSFIVRLPLYPG